MCVLESFCRFEVRTHVKNRFSRPCIHRLVGRVSDYRAGGRAFKPRPDHHLGSLNN